MDLLVRADRAEHGRCRMSGPEHFDPAPLPQWQADRLATLLDALDGTPISGAEHASLEWLAGFEAATVENVAAVIRRAGRADELAAAVAGFLAAWDSAAASWRSLDAPVLTMRRAHKRRRTS